MSSIPTGTLLLLPSPGKQQVLHKTPAPMAAGQFSVGSKHAHTKCPRGLQTPLTAEPWAGHPRHLGNSSADRRRQRPRRVCPGDFLGDGAQRLQEPSLTFVTSPQWPETSLSQDTASQ